MFSVKCIYTLRPLTIPWSLSKLSARNLHLDQVMDMTKYPIYEPESAAYKDLVDYHRKQLKTYGVTTLPGLMKEDAIAIAVEEIEGKMDSSYTMQTDHNIYLKGSDQAKAKDHIRNKRLDTKVAALACDELDEESPLKVIFRSDSFNEFIRQVLSLPSLYRNVDPVGAVFVNIYKDGYKHNWHFDESQWSTTILLQEADSGGDFQFTKPFRNENGETETYTIAEEVVTDNDCKHVNTLEFKPGTLSIFQGRRSLHSVTKCYGQVPRLLGVLHFSQQEGIRNSPGVQELFWGKIVQDRTYEPQTFK